MFMTFIIGAPDTKNFVQTTYKKFYLMDRRRLISITRSDILIFPTFCLCPINYSIIGLSNSFPLCFFFFVTRCLVSVSFEMQIKTVLGNSETYAIFCANYRGHPLRLSFAEGQFY